MAVYPIFNQTSESSETWEDNLQVERSSNGTARARSFYTNKKMMLRLSHVLLRSDVNTILDFYDENKELPFDVLWQGDSTTRQFIFTAPPEVATDNGAYWKVSCSLMEV